MLNRSYGEVVTIKSVDKVVTVKSVDSYSNF